MKAWKIFTLSFIAFAAVALTAASVYAYGWRGFGAPSLTPTTFNPATQTVLQNPTPQVQTNTQVPTLYTPPSPQTLAPVNQPYQGTYGMGGCMGGMMGGWSYRTPTYQSPRTATQLTISQAAQIAQTYVATLNDPDLTVTQVEEYTANFYVQVGEKSTGYGAFQLLINKYTGAVFPEMGPNMMWNTKYTFTTGMCNWFRGTTTAAPTVTLDQAKANAQEYLNTYLPGTTVGDETTFYGYYNVEVLNNGVTYGMLSVNAYTGQVWYHTWHGTFIQELQL